MSEGGGEGGGGEGGSEGGEGGGGGESGGCEGGDGGEGGGGEGGGGEGETQVASCTMQLSAPKKPGIPLEAHMFHICNSGMHPSVKGEPRQRQRLLWHPLPVAPRLPSQLPRLTERQQVHGSVMALQYVVASGNRVFGPKLPYGTKP